MISIVIPIFNERDSLPILHEQLLVELPRLNRDFEIIFVDDGSRDDSAEVLRDLTSRFDHTKAVFLRKNFGQTAAMMAGIDFASGDIIVPMDGDLQNDPADIGKLIERLDEGFDVVSGWRSSRKDAALTRNLPSWLANKLISWVSGVRLHDYGCSLKAYRKDVIKDVKLYGEMHRFIPIYASWQGAKITEMPVTHHARIHGASKYGLERVLKVLLDLIVVKFLASYATKPIYVFGGFGLATLAISFFSALLAFYLRLVHGVSFILTPLPLLTVMAFITGVMSVLLGLVAELVVRTYYEAQDKPVYLVKETLNIATDPLCVE